MHFKSYKYQGTKFGLRLEDTKHLSICRRLLKRIRLSRNRTFTHYNNVGMVVILYILLLNGVKTQRLHLDRWASLAAHSSSQNDVFIFYWYIYNSVNEFIHSTWINGVDKSYAALMLIDIWNIICFSLPLATTNKPDWSITVLFPLCLVGFKVHRSIEVLILK